MHIKLKIHLNAIIIYNFLSINYIVCSALSINPDIEKDLKFSNLSAAKKVDRLSRRVLISVRCHLPERFSHFNKSFTKISIPNLISDIQMYIRFETESPSGNILFCIGSPRSEMGSTYVCPIGKL